MIRISTHFERLIEEKVFDYENPSGDIAISQKIGLLLRPTEFEPNEHLSIKGFRTQFHDASYFTGFVRAYLKKYGLIQTFSEQPSAMCQNQLIGLCFESVVDYQFDRFLTGGYACSNEYAKFFGTYDRFSIDDIEKLSRTCCVLEFCFQHFQHTVKLKILLEKLLPYRHLTTIRASSIEAFRKYIARKKKIGLPQALVHGSIGKPSNNSPLTDSMQRILIELAINGRVFKPANIVKQELDRLVALTPKSETCVVYSISVSKINEFLNTPRARNLLAFCLSDPKEFRRHVTGHLHFIRASAPMVKVSVDAYVYQISYSDDETGKIDYRVGVHFHDDNSDFVFSVSLDKSENGNSFSRAFREFLVWTEGRLPRQLYMDGHTFKMLNSLPRLLAFLKRNGVYIKYDPNPNNRTSLERLFLTLQQKQLIKHLNYLGPGIKSRKKLSHPSKAYRLIMNHKRNSLKEYELDRIIKILVTECHNKKFTGNDLMTPEERICRTKWDQVGQIDLRQWEPFLFFDRHKVTIRAGEITVPIQSLPPSRNAKKRETITRNIGNDFYKTREKEFLDTFNNCKVDAYIDQDDPRVAHIYLRDEWNKVTEMNLYTRVPNNDYDRSKEQKEIVRDFNVQSEKLNEQYQNEIGRIEGTIEYLTGIPIDEVTETGVFSRQEKALSKSHAAGLDEDDDLEDRISRQLFNPQKSRRKRRLKFDSDDEWGIEFEDPISDT